MFVVCFVSWALHRRVVFIVPKLPFTPLLTFSFLFPSRVSSVDLFTHLRICEKGQILKSYQTLCRANTYISLRNTRRSTVGGDSIKVSILWRWWKEVRNSFSLMKWKKGIAITEWIKGRKEIIHYTTWKSFIYKSQFPDERLSITLSRRCESENILFFWSKNELEKGI